MLHQIIGAQVRSGNAVSLVYSIRDNVTPPLAELIALFPSPVQLLSVRMNTGISPIEDFSSTLMLMKSFKALDPDVIHLHSSKAGALGRIAARFCGKGSRVFYSPHGFAFLRKDVSKFQRFAYFAFEAIGAYIAGKVIVSCVSEELLAKRVIMKSRVANVENCTDVLIKSMAKGSSGGSIKVVAAGRLCFQKAPWVFWDLAKKLQNTNAEFIWIGDGELRSELHARNSSVVICGWKSRDTLWEMLQEADIFVMPSLWEGMPLTLIDAQVIGVPAVVSDVVGCRDVVRNGETGFVCETVDEIFEKVELLVRNASLRAKFEAKCRDGFGERFSVERMNVELNKVYFEKTGSKQ